MSSSELICKHVVQLWPASLYISLIKLNPILYFCPYKIWYVYKDLHSDLKRLLSVLSPPSISSFFPFLSSNSCQVKELPLVTSRSRAIGGRRSLAHGLSPSSVASHRQSQLNCSISMHSGVHSPFISLGRGCCGHPYWNWICMISERAFSEGLTIMQENYLLFLTCI